VDVLAFAVLDDGDEVRVLLKVPEVRTGIQLIQQLISSDVHLI